MSGRTTEKVLGCRVLGKVLVFMEFSMVLAGRKVAHGGVKGPIRLGYKKLTSMPPALPILSVAIVVGLV